jgi:hypothetical protein
VRRDRRNRGTAIGEGGKGGAPTWSREELAASEWRWDALSKRAGRGRSPLSSPASWRRSCASILLPTSSTSVICRRGRSDGEGERSPGKTLGGWWWVAGREGEAEDDGGSSARFGLALVWPGAGMRFGSANLVPDDRRAECSREMDFSEYFEI